jgi:hypothetical protein
MKKLILLAILISLLVTLANGQIKIGSPNIVMGTNIGYIEIQTNEDIFNMKVPFSFAFEGGLRYLIQNRRKNYHFKYDVLGYYEYSQLHVLNMNSAGLKSQFHLAETNHKSFYICMVLGIHGTYSKFNEFLNQNFSYDSGTVGIDFDFCISENPNIIFGFKYNFYFLPNLPKESMFYEKNHFETLIFDIGFLLNTKNNRR